MERLPELTPDHRVVVELSELQLPTLSHGTTVAALHERHRDQDQEQEAGRGHEHDALLQAGRPLFLSCARDHGPDPGRVAGAYKLTLTESFSACALRNSRPRGRSISMRSRRSLAQASESESSVTQIVKHLNGLCTNAINRVYKDERRGLFPLLEAGQSASLRSAWRRAPTGVTRSMARSPNISARRRRAGTRSWRVSRANREIAGEEPGRALLVNAIDVLVAEMLTAPRRWRICSVQPGPR